MKSAIKKRKIIFGVSVILVTIFLLINFVFPFSVISFNKSFSYTPDPKFLLDYNVAVEEFSNRINSEGKNSISPVFSGILHIINQSYFTKPESNVRLKDIKNMEKNLLRLSDELNLLYTQKKYTEEDRVYIKSLLNSISNMLTKTYSIKDARNTTFKLDDQFYRVHLDVWNVYQHANTLLQEFDIKQR